MEFANGLRPCDFTRIASHGFGDPRNSYPHTMVCYRDHLYVGTTRNILHLVKIAPDPSTDVFHCWPVHVPPGTNAATLDQRCQIWRCNLKTGQWTMVHESPLIESNGLKVWRDFGYRSMVVTQTESDSSPVLYVTTMSSSKAPGAYILRSTDGQNFVPITKPGMEDTGVSSFRAFVAFKGRLYTSPAGKGRLWAYASSPVVLESTDPVSGHWYPVSEPGFGDENNLTIFEMAVFNGHLYAGTGNAASGFQVWKTRAEGNPPYRWEKVISEGAYRGRLNEVVMSMFVFDNALYIGGGIRRGGYDREFNVGPAAAELIRIHPDDTWDLIVGSTRCTPLGRKEPLSGIRPGFGNPFIGYIWSMAEYDKHLYVGTYDSSVFLTFMDLRKVPPTKHQLLRQIGIDNIVAFEGGFDLWNSADGITWNRVTRNGFGNPYNYGVRTMIGHRRGLFLGVANPFAPEVAVKTLAGWTYAPNPNGGLQIWQGRQPQINQSNMNNNERTDTMRFRNIKTNPGNPPDEREAINRQYEQGLNHPLLGPFSDLFEGSNFANYGFWYHDTQNPREACENLMEALLSLVPEKQGNVLDVACGFGGTTNYLLKYYPPEAITGIDISEKQLEICRDAAPGCNFLFMDATDMAFEDNTFDTIISVEAAFHFHTRTRFFQEAYRVLKPGGRLVLSDVLYKPWAETVSPVLCIENYVADPVVYENSLKQAGFDKVEIADVTKESWNRPHQYLLFYLTDKFSRGEIGPWQFKAMLANRFVRFSAAQYYILAAARRPPEKKKSKRTRNPKKGDQK